tara:strand:+ start:44488 stop:45264 length:777 start_codon:yes stop_codon:yes gene_type:complete
MTLEASLLITTRLLSFTMLFQAIEIFILSRQTNFRYVWSYNNLRCDLEQGLPLKKKWVENLFSISSLQKIAILQILLACTATLYPHAAIFTGLFLTHLLICIRFRGAFNGGSDMMTFVVLTGTIVATLGFTKIGLIYIATHTLYSYFKAGLAKIKHKEWQNGQAIPAFLSRSLFPDIQNTAAQLANQKAINLTLGIGTLIFELSVLGLLFAPNASQLYFALAVVFHLAVYFCFGLNRFFWIWLTAWPATLFSLSLLTH